jgi:hypothetical protein
MRLRIFGVSVGIATLGVIVLTKLVYASGVDRCGGNVGSCAEGGVSVYKDVTDWSLTVLDYMKDGNCAYAKMIIDRNNRSDTEIRSPNACGQGNTTSFNGNVQYSGTRGARLEVCIDKNNLPDQCTKIHYEYEID